MCAGRGKSSAETQEGAESCATLATAVARPKSGMHSPPGLPCSPNFMQYVVVFVNYFFFVAVFGEKEREAGLSLAATKTDDACVVAYGCGACCKSLFYVMPATPSFHNANCLVPLLPLSTAALVFRNIFFNYSGAP